MLAALLYGSRDMRIEDVAIPEIDDNEILLKVKSAAVCGTDIRMFNNGYKGIDESNPRILGHELSGIIAKVGKNVKGYKEGMEVAVAPNMGCGLCDQCVSGNTHLCHNYRALGINIDGGFAEYVKIPEAAVRQGNVVELDGVSTEEAALNEPLSCVYSGFEKCNIRPGDVVLIIGAGPIGLMHAKLAKMAGAAKVVINDLSKERLEMCCQIDSTFVTITGGHLKDYVYEATKGRGVDVCITACPAPQAQAMALELMAMGGRINFFGGLPKDRENVVINTNLIHYKQLIITGSTRASVSQFRKTLGFISNGLIRVDDLITGRYSLTNITEAFEMASSARGLKNIIVFK
ncbi:MAG: alcohol dehydrogenase catalytic domain-containing protein [Clostridiales bacterium]|nr:alcohol dehydrogenase catalytic domain-containing protein [Clostridiales bacterium]